MNSQPTTQQVIRLLRRAAKIAKNSLIETSPPDKTRDTVRHPLPPELRTTQEHFDAFTQTIEQTTMSRALCEILPSEEIWTIYHVFNRAAPQKVRTIHLEINEEAFVTNGNGETVRISPSPQLAGKSMTDSAGKITEESSLWIAFYATQKFGTAWLERTIQQRRKKLFHQLRASKPRTQEQRRADALKIAYTILFIAEERTDTR